MSCIRGDRVITGRLSGDRSSTGGRRPTGTATFAVLSVAEPELGRYPLPWNTTSTLDAAPSALRNYDYAGQDPINGYDLNGECYANAAGRCQWARGSSSAKFQMIVTWTPREHRWRVTCRSTGGFSCARINDSPGLLAMLGGAGVGCLKAVYDPKSLVEGWVGDQTLEYLKGTRWFGKGAAVALRYDWVVDAGTCVAGAVGK